MTERMHTVTVHTYPPDGKQFVACTCPIDAHHAPADIVREVEGEPGMYWVRFTSGWRRG